MSRIRAFLLDHRVELLLFGAGLALFAGGLVTVFVASTPGGQQRPAPVSPSPSFPRMGPPRGEPLAAYIERKRRLLRAGARDDPQTVMFAIASFDGYRTAAQVEEVFRPFGMAILEVHMRVPLPGFSEERSEVEGGSIEQALAGKAAHIREEMTQELNALKEIIPTVEEANFRAVYEADARRLEEALLLLDSDPALVFAVVVRGSNADLRKLAAVRGVRFVDVADPPGASPQTHRFAGVLPEDSDTQSF